MIRGTKLFVFASGITFLCGRPAAAQSLPLRVSVSEQCEELNHAILAQVSNGQWQEAEGALADALASGDKSLEPSCAALVLTNLSARKAISGQPADAEAFAQRAVRILDQTYPPDHLVLLRPLQILAASRLEQGKLGKAREAFARMRLIAVVRTQDRALVHGVAAAFLYEEHKLPEAESEYLAAISDFNEAGRGDSADAAACSFRSPRSTCSKRGWMMPSVSSGGFSRSLPQPRTPFLLTA